MKNYKRSILIGALGMEMWVALIVITLHSASFELHDIWRFAIAGFSGVGFVKALWQFAMNIYDWRYVRTLSPAQQRAYVIIERYIG